MNNREAMQEAFETCERYAGRDFTKSNGVYADDGVQHEFGHFLEGYQAALASQAQAQQTDRKVGKKDFILRGTDCEYLCAIKNKWIPAKFLTLSFGGAEPLVQASGKMPVFCTWNTFRGIEKQVIFDHFLLSPAPEGGDK